MKRTKVICISGKAQHGKDTAGKYIKQLLEQEGKRVIVAHYADLVKYVAKMFLGWDGNKDETGRTLLQYVGTDIVRKKSPNYWVDFIGQIITLFDDANLWDCVIIPDCRFPNEIEVLAEDYDIEVWSVRVVRNNFESPLTEAQKNHPSETAMDDYRLFDAVLENDGTEAFVDEITSKLAPIVRCWDAE